ncbi:MAG TPA: hypothetical protein VH459_02855 [Gaiellales bacterium]|jgi:hypothetical protein
MAFQRLAGERSRAERIQAALVAHPEIREIALETNDRLFDEAAERFAAALEPGVTMRLEVAHAIGIVAAGAVNSAAGDDRFRAAREVVIAGYIWRMCELDPELMRRRAGEAFAAFGEAPAAARFQELRRERPGECATTLVAQAASQAVEAGDPAHLQSPGGPAFGRRFLGRGAALSRATVPAAARLEAAEHDALFAAGVCLRDAEPALADEPQTERVHVGITPAAPARST